ncbi:Protein F32D8.7 a [Aphelenchoides avenae]|nr:Protein F32D8.7 a [Aphelenchus avenae]
MGVPEGRFCGFQLKYTFNKETGNCEQFWFPGCKTEETNENLFDTEVDCRQVTRTCSVVPPPAPVPKPSPRGRRPPPASQKSTSPGGGNNGLLGLGGLTDLVGGALGGGNGNFGGGPQPARSLGRPDKSEYGGGNLGTSGGGVTQPPNFLRLIANTIREVGEGRNSAPGGAGGNNWLKSIDPNQFMNIFKSL